MDGLGKRIKEACNKVGGVEAVADMTGIKRSTLYYYVREKSEPKVSALIQIAQATRTPVNWIILGAAEDVVSQAINNQYEKQINPVLFRKIAKIIARNADDGDASSKLEDTAIATMDAYNAIMQKADDPSDMKELLSLIPWVENRFGKNQQPA